MSFSRQYLGRVEEILTKLDVKRDDMPEGLPPDCESVPRMKGVPIRSRQATVLYAALFQLAAAAYEQEKRIAELERLVAPKDESPGLSAFEGTLKKHGVKLD